MIPWDDQIAAIGREHQSFILLPIFSAMPMKASLLALSGSATTVGFPRSASSHILASSGTSPNNSMPWLSQVLATPSEPKICVTWPHFGQLNTDMFCTIPRIGTETFWNMDIPFTASLRATSCGVDTTTAPSSLTCCVMVSCVSPVPGGRSKTSTSSPPHSTSCRSCCKAFITMRPRHTTAAFSSTR